MPFEGPGNGAEGVGWLNWAAAAITSSTNRMTSVMAVARRTPEG